MPYYEQLSNVGILDLETIVQIYDAVDGGPIEVDEMSGDPVEGTQVAVRLSSQVVVVMGTEEVEVRGPDGISRKVKQSRTSLVDSFELSREDYDKIREYLEHQLEERFELDPDDDEPDADDEDRGPRVVSFGARAGDQVGGPSGKEAEEDAEG